MIIELSEFFNNPSLIEIGPLKIQYYAVTWLLSAVFIYLFLKSNQIMIELGLNHEKVNDLVFLYGLFIGAMCCLLYTSPSPRDRTRSRMPSSA